MATFLQQVDGNMLRSNLLRYGENLAFETNLLFLDVANSRIGIGTVSPQTPLHVTGASTLDNVSISTNTISTTTLDQDLILSPNGNGFVIASQAKISNLANEGVVIAGISGELSTDTGLTYNTASGLSAPIAAIGGINFSAGTLTYAGNITITATGGNVSTNSLKVLDLPQGTIPFANASNTLTSTATLQWDETFNTLTILGKLVVDDMEFDTNSISTTVGPLTLAPLAGEDVVISSTSALQVPVGTDLQRPAAPVAGDLRFNTTSNQLECYNGTTWQVAGTDFQAITYDTFTGDDVTTTFTLTTTPADAANVFVSINGVVQQPNSAYSVTGNQITFTTAPASTDIIDVRELVRSYSFGSLSDSTGQTKVDTLAGNVTVTAGNTARLVANANGILDISGSESLRLPQLSTVQVQALANMSAGDTVYVTDGNAGTPCLAVYDGTNWQKVLFDGVL